MLFDLRVSKEQAMKELMSIPHNACLNGIENNWKVENEKASFQSVCWLFCWAKSGMNSNKAKLKAREVFNKLFYISYEEFKNSVGYIKAQEYRRKKRMVGKDIEIVEKLLEAIKKSI